MTGSVLAVDTVVQLGDWSVTARFSAASGEVLGLAGDIGSGKSTVLSLLAGQRRASSGSVRFGDVIWDSDAAFVAPADRPVAHLAQRGQLIDDQPADEQVGGAVASLVELNLDPAVTARDGWTLSRGEAQRVLLAAAVGAEAQVLLLDDPFAALDAATGRLVRDWLAARLAARSGVTVFVSSDPADLDRFATRIFTLGD